MVRRARFKSQRAPPVAFLYCSRCLRYWFAAARSAMQPITPQSYTNIIVRRYFIQEFPAQGSQIMPTNEPLHRAVRIHIVRQPTQVKLANIARGRPLFLQTPWQNIDTSDTLQRLNRYWWKSRLLRDRLPDHRRHWPGGGGRGVGGDQNGCRIGQIPLDSHSCSHLCGVAAFWIARLRPYHQHYPCIARELCPIFVTM